MKRPQYLSYILSDAHRWWKPGSLVFISAHPGAGKTTFILRVLLKYAIDTRKEILYLSNREILHKQILREVCKIFDIPFEYFEDEKFAEFPGITLTTYQTIAERLSTDQYYSNIAFYNYVVMDESHFFVEDSDFNAKIQSLLRWRERIQCDVEIYISATIDDVLIEFGYWNTEWKTIYEDDVLEVRERIAHDIIRNLKGETELLFYYHISPEFPSFNIFVYDDIRDVIEVINNDETEEKWILFQSNKETAKRITAKNLKHASVVITADDKESNAMGEIIENQHFKAKVLITTKVLDNGVSLCDDKIKNILIETTSRTEFIQMMGRRRLGNDEDVTLNLYIPRLHDRYFKSMIIRRIQPLLDLTVLSHNALLTIAMDSDAGYKSVKALFDAREGRLILNPLAEKRLNEKKKYFEKLSKKIEIDPNYFVKEQLAWLGIKDYTKIVFVTEMKFQSKLKELIDYLGAMAERELTKKQQSLFRTEIKVFVQELLPEKLSNNSRVPGITVINDCLEALEVPYRVKSFSGKRKGDETIWKIIKHGPAISA